jgi:hypothetical protein
MMKKSFFAMSGLVAFLVSTVVAQASQAGQCVVAGRLNEASQWAPRIAAVQLFDAQGKMVSISDKGALARVTQVKINKAVPLSSCDGNQALKKVDDLSDGGAAGKPTFLQPSSGLIAVKTVAFPSLRAGNGSLVEIELQ